MDARLKAEQTPAVVVGAQGNGLGVVRSLASAGLQATVVGDTLRDPAMWSRRCKNHLIERSFGRPLVDGLLELQESIATRPVLILTDELAVNTVSEHRAELGACYRIRLPSPEMVDTLGDKELFQGFAEAHALPVPRTIVVKAESDLAQIAQLGSPVIIKPADKFLVHMGRIERLSVAGSIDDAAATCRRFLTLGETPVVQEWIDGPDSNIYFALFHCGLSPASRSIFFGRKIAAHPPRVGSTAVCVPAPEAAELLRPVTERFLEAARYEGLGSLEFKWDPRERRFVIIEPTVGRTDSQEEIAALNGLNLAFIAYCYELGLPVPKQTTADAVAWRESLRSIGIRSGLRSHTYDGYWRVDDPMPAFVYCVDLAIRAGRRLMRRLRPTTLPRRRHRPA
jgi:D-aspartate ligase